MHKACKACEFAHECTMGGFMAVTVTTADCPARLTLLASKKTGHQLNPVPEKIDYKFNEGALIAQFKEYVDGTYSEHYSNKDVQTFELIRKAPERAFGFLDGNIIKYADRNKGQQRKDYLKIMHYALLALNELERNNDQ